MPAENSTTGKDVCIVASGGGLDAKRYDVTIHKGVTADDILRKLKLTGILSKFGNPEPISPVVDLYPLVKDGDKLMLAPGTPVAGGCLR
jgi:hypothetical protein